MAAVPGKPDVLRYDTVIVAGGDPNLVKDLQAASAFARSKDIVLTKDDNLGKILAKIFDQLVEPKLIKPTFVYGYPIEISPLSRRNDQDTDLADRFELFIGGKWLGGDGRKGEDVINPATEKTLAHLPHASKADLDHALEAAKKGFAVNYAAQAVCIAVADKVNF